MIAKVKKVSLPETLLPPTKEYHNGKPREPLFVPPPIERYRESNEKGRATALRNRLYTMSWTEEDIQKVLEMRGNGLTWKAIGKELGITGDAVRRKIERVKRQQETA